MVGISVPMAGREASSEGRVVSIAGSDRSGAAEEPTEGSAESKEGNPVSSKESEPSKFAIVGSIGGRDDSIEGVTFGVSLDWRVSSFMLLASVCWFVLRSACATSTGNSLTGAGC